jgi:uncharacterized delta-60 repeat protein
VRYRKSGARDRSFSRDGRVKTPARFSIDLTPGIYSVALLPNGKMVAGGRSGGEVGKVVRYRKHGKLDHQFGQPDDWLGGPVSDLAIQSDGRIVAAGTLSFGKDCPCHFTVGRLFSSGEVDFSFGGDGELSTSFAPPGTDPNTGGYWSGASSVLVQPDGKIVAAGEAGAGSAGYGWGLARYLPDGSLDSSFSGDGLQTTFFDGEGGRISEAVLQSDGKIVAAGTVSTHYFGVARYNPDGSLDPTFSGDGRVVTEMGDYAGASDVVLQPDGKIVVVGSVGNANFSRSSFALARYNADGSPDSSFDGDGTLVASGFGDGDYFAEAAVLQANGRIVVAGRAFTVDGERIVVVRFR